MLKFSEKGNPYLCHTMQDITTRQDIEELVDAFYKQVLADELIGHFFTQVVKLDWEQHMPTMYNFWESVLLGNMQYKGNPMIKHIALHQKQALEPAHFERWLGLWEQTIDAKFAGTKADEAKLRARQIAGLMQHKIQEHDAKSS